MTDDQIDSVLDEDDGTDDFPWHDSARWTPEDEWGAEPDDPFHAYHWEEDEDDDLIDMTAPPPPIVRGRRPRHAPIVTLSGESRGQPLLWVQPSGMGVGPERGYWAGAVELVAAATVMRERLPDPNDTRALAYVVTRLCDTTDDATGVLGLDYEMRGSL